MRRILVAGNWKMNAGPEEAKILSGELVKFWSGKELKSEVLICPPYVSIPFVAKYFRDTPLKTGAQNVHTEPGGAYTGEISASMLKELSCAYIIVGHSERREYFNEDNKWVALKAVRVLEEGMRPIVCVGEKLEERKKGTQKEIVKEQLSAVLNQLSPEHAGELVIAYEPVWAIGTGETASAQQAQEMHAYIRLLVKEKWGAGSDVVRILYGGSMKPGNAGELISQPDVDGGLIGGASLDAQSFSEIIKVAESISG